MQPFSQEVPSQRKPEGGPVPPDAQTTRNKVQGLLMARFSEHAKDPDEAYLEWTLRYNGAFRQLFSDPSFYRLVEQAYLLPDGQEKSELLSRIQDKLEKHVESQPELADSEEQIDNENKKYLAKNDPDLLDSAA